MSVPIPLSVPVPALSFVPLLGARAPLEQPLAISFSPVMFPDGSPVVAEESVGARALVTRRATATSVVEVWDARAKLWTPVVESALAALEGVPLAPPDGAGGSWQGMLVALGSKDLAGFPQIAASVAHYPQYRLRGVFEALREGQRALGVGAESGPVEFGVAATEKPFGIDLEPDPESAARARFVLRDGSAQPIGYFEVDASGSGAVVTLANANAGAKIELLADGSIRLSPASGSKVVIAADLVVGQVSYLPAGGSGRQNLV